MRRKASRRSVSLVRLIHRHEPTEEQASLFAGMGL
jgi:hypothetical protein